MDPRRFIILLLSLVSVSLIAEGLLSMRTEEVTYMDTYPERAIRAIVPFGAGGSLDFIARSTEKFAMKYLGQPFVITNVPGGSGTIGFNEIAGAKNDGYTIGFINIEIILQPLYTSTRYHYMSALDPLAQIGTSPMVVAVLADQHWQNITDLVAYAQRHPGEIKYGHQGLGTVRHILGEMFAQEAGIHIVQVPFSQGEAEALTALLGGHVQVLFTGPAVIKDHVRSGRVRVLAVAEEKRLTDPLFANVPTFKEQGLNVVISSWAAIGVPKQLPKGIKDKLAEGLKNIICDPEFKTYLENVGLIPDYLGPEECQYKWMADNERLSKFIKESGIAEIIAKLK